MHVKSRCITYVAVVLLCSCHEVKFEYKDAVENIVIEDDALPPPEAFVPYETPPAPGTRVQPKYPELARKAGIEGTVYIKILVDKQGMVRDAILLRGIGGGLDEAALEAVKKWMYTPAIQNNMPVAVWVAQPINFRLR